MTAAHGAAPAAVAALLMVAVYLTAARRLRHRGDAWPQARDASFAAGGIALAAAIAVPPPAAPFTGHMAQHLVAGMVAPLLLVLARPLTLALRVLRPGRVRRALLVVAHSRYAVWVTFPPAAALFDVGGLWLLYRTPLFAATHHLAWLHVVVHLHVLAAGTLLAFAVCALDPPRRRWSLRWRAGALLAAGAAHAVLAKTLYAAPPPGTTFATADLRAGAQLMYYGGDLVELALAVTLAVQWYAATGRALAADRRRNSVTRAVRG
ncbi:cytochrome c oxidase assembly protein [Nonomuraea sp. SYSU D8015]|uniref:cytochrome c oxidase assembly protein n=1 Tax=Nonomuraea sp. SYSU D8015 TaxID=2593644 RepID=UPI001660AE84|nr:cytochrome c oxidase assembly protein [Nonomuraea sp. SYSU D8015]